MINGHDTLYIVIIEKFNSVQAYWTPKLNSHSKYRRTPGISALDLNIQVGAAIQFVYRKSQGNSIEIIAESSMPYITTLDKTSISIIFFSFTTTNNQHYQLITTAIDYCQLLINFLTWLYFKVNRFSFFFDISVKKERHHQWAMSFVYVCYDLLPKTRQLAGVHKQLGKTHQLQSSSDKARSDDVVNKKGTVVR